METAGKGDCTAMCENEMMGTYYHDLPIVHCVMHFVRNQRGFHDDQVLWFVVRGLIPFSPNRTKASC